MKTTNVKVTVNNQGQIEVIGLKKDGTPSSVNYVVTEVEGIREFAKTMMAAGVAKASEPKASEQPKQEKPAQTVINKKGYTSVNTDGKLFSKPSVYKHNGVYHAVKFEIAGKGQCIVGFAKDRNAFIEAFNGEQKETTRTEVLKRLSKYEGKDAALVVKAISNIKPVSMDAGQCGCCGTKLTRGVREYSVRNYGMMLCRECQTDFKPATVEPSESEAEQKLNEVLKKDICECGRTKLTQENMCIACADAKYEAQNLKELDELMDNEEGKSVDSSERVIDEEVISDADKASEERTSAVEEDANELESKGAVDPMSLFSDDELIVKPVNQA